MVTLPFGITIGRSEKAPLSQPTDTPPGAFDQRRGDREVGAPGTVYYSGFLDNEEYNQDLRGDKAIATYTKMLSDGMVQAMIRSIVLPLRSATPRFEPASEDAKDLAVAKACEAVLLEMKGQRWDDFIRQAFTGTLVYGHSAFEQVWTRPGQPGAKGEATYEPNLIAHEGKQLIAPYKLAPRLAKTLYRWIIDRDGELTGVQQRVWHGTLPPGSQPAAGETTPDLPTGSYHFITIPRDRLFLFVLEQEGANYLGRSVLRAAYKHWFYKENHLRIAALAAERQGVGVPYAITKQGISASETTAIVNALRSLHAHEKAYIIANEGQLADATKTGMDSLGIMNMNASGTEKVDVMILYHDRQMALSILADFLTLGSGTGGNANVMHRDKTSMFYESLLGIKKPFEDNYQSTIVDPFVHLNWGEDTVPPKFHLTGMEAKDLESRGRGLAMLFTAGALTATPETENQLREEMDLPLLDEGPDGEPEYPQVTPPGSPGPTTKADIGKVPAAGAAPPALAALGPLAAPAARTKGMEDPSNAQLSEAVLEWITLPKEARRRAAVALLGGELPNPKVKRLADPARAAAVAALLLQAKARHQQVVDEMAANGDQLLNPDDGYGQQDFTRDNVAAIRRAAEAVFAAGFVIGLQDRGQTKTTPAAARIVGARTPLPAGVEETAAAAWGMKVAAEVTPFVQGLAGEIAAGDVARDEVVNRAAAQAGVIWTSAFRGESAALGDTFRAVWITEGGPETCDLCDARDGEEFDQDSLPGYPGEGVFGDLCEGGPNCRCSLEFLEPDEADAELGERPRILVEARCPKCRTAKTRGRLIGRNVNAGALLFCPRCRTEVAAG